MKKQKILKTFQKLADVDLTIVEDLWNLNIKKISDLKKIKRLKNTILKLCKIQKTKVDRCMLCVFRCIVSFANTKNADRKNFKRGILRIKNDRYHLY